MGRLRKSRMHKQNKAIKRNFRVQNRTKDADQIWVDLQEHREALSSQPVDPDLPGGGQFYDIECAKYFQTQEAFDEHKKSKVHKKQVKAMKERPFDPDRDPC